MTHLYEYSVMLYPLTFKTETGENIDFSRQETHALLTQKLAGFTNKLPDAMEKLPFGEGWGINSHSVAFIGNTLMVSILLQRLRK